MNKDTGFDDFKNRLLELDPVYWVEKYLTIDGKPFKLSSGGWKPFADIYRYIGIKALEQDSLPLLVVKGRQVGFSIASAALELYFACCGQYGTNGKPPVRLLHLFPLAEIAERFSKEKLGPMINSSLQLSGERKGQTKSYIRSLMSQASESSESQKFKSFRDGNFIRVDNSGISGDRIRGTSADIIFMDEFQDIPTEAVGNILESLKQSCVGPVGRGVQVFFGTPKRKGSDFHKMWQVSTQYYYHLGCEKCKELFPFYTPESNDWEKVWIHGFVVKCSKCGHEQDKNGASSRGKWISLNNIDESEVRFCSFHYNQLLIPTLSRELIESEKPGNHPTNTERKFQNEVLGEFYQGDSSPITAEEIIEACGDRERGLRKQIKPGEEQLVVLGIDYGARSDIEQLANPNKTSGGMSYTTAVLMSVKGPNLFNIDLAIKFPKNDPESKKGIIDTIIRQYSVNLCVADIGFSNDFSHTMHTIYGDKYLVSRAAGRVNDKVKFYPDKYPKEIDFERDHFIGEMFELLKKGQIKFPLKDYDRISWLIEHCASLELKPSISRYGDHSIHYVKGSGSPNDGFMALLNAYLAYKFYITSGFKINNPHLMNKPTGKKEQVPAILGNITRRF